MLFLLKVLCKPWNNASISVPDIFSVFCRIKHGIKYQKEKKLIVLVIKGHFRSETFMQKLSNPQELDVKSARERTN